MLGVAASVAIADTKSAQILSKRKLAKLQRLEEKKRFWEQNQKQEPSQGRREQARQVRAGGPKMKRRDYANQAQRRSDAEAFSASSRARKAQAVIRLMHDIETNPGPVKYGEQVGYSEKILDKLWQQDPEVAQVLADDKKYAYDEIIRNLEYAKLSPLHAAATAWQGLHSVTRVGPLWQKHLPALRKQELYHHTPRGWIRASKLTKKQRVEFRETALQPAADDELEQWHDSSSESEDDAQAHVIEKSADARSKRQERQRERQEWEKQSQNLKDAFKDDQAALAIVALLNGRERTVDGVWRKVRRSGLKNIRFSKACVDRVFTALETLQQADGDEPIFIDIPENGEGTQRFGKEDTFEQPPGEASSEEKQSSPSVLTGKPQDPEIHIVSTPQRPNLTPAPGLISFEIIGDYVSVNAGQDAIGMLGAGASKGDGPTELAAEINKQIIADLAAAQMDKARAAELEERASAFTGPNVAYNLQSGLHSIAETVLDKVPGVGPMVKPLLDFPTVPTSETFVKIGTLGATSPAELRAEAAQLREEAGIKEQKAVDGREALIRLRAGIEGAPATRNFRRQAFTTLLICTLLLVAGIEPNPGPLVHGYSSYEGHDEHFVMETDTKASWELTDAELESYAKGEDPSKFFSSTSLLLESGLANPKNVTHFETDFLRGLTVTGPRNAAADPNENLTSIQMNIASGDNSIFFEQPAVEQGYWPSRVHDMPGGAWQLLVAEGWPVADVSATRTSFIRDKRVDTALATDLERLGTQIVSRSTWQGATIKGDRAQDVFTMSTLPGEQLPEFTAPCLKLLALLTALQARERPSRQMLANMFRSVSSTAQLQPNPLTPAFGTLMPGTPWAGVPFATSRFGPQNANQHRLRIYLDWDSSTNCDYTHIYFSDIYDVRDFALYMWMVSEFPAVNFGIDGVFGPPIQHIFCTKTDFLWRIFGASNIAVILSSAFATPTFMPSAGPLAYGAFAANEVLVASTHQVAVDYPLGDFLMTWLSPDGLRSSDVQMFNQTVLRDLSARYDMEAARYIHPTLAFWYRPPVLVTEPNATGVFVESDYYGGLAPVRIFMPHCDVYNNRAAMGAYTNHSGRGLLLPYTDWASVNKLWLGFEKSEFQTRTAVTYTQNEFHALSRQWSVLIARLIRCAHEAAISSTGLSISALGNAPLANVTNDSLARIAGILFYGEDDAPPGLQYLAVAFLSFLSGNLFPESKLGFDVFKAARRSRAWADALNYASLSAPTTLSTAEWYSVCRRVPTEHLYPPRRPMWQMSEGTSTAVVRTYGNNISVPAFKSPYNVTEHSLAEYTNARIVTHLPQVASALAVVDGDATLSTTYALFTGLRRALRPYPQANGWPLLCTTQPVFDAYQDRRIQMQTPTGGAVANLIAGSYSRDCVAGASHTFNTAVQMPLFSTTSAVSKRMAGWTQKARSFFLAAEMDQRPSTAPAEGVGEAAKIAAAGGAKARS